MSNTVALSTAPDASKRLQEQLASATIGKYDIYAELGRGGMAAVFLALDIPLNRSVAIKVMLPEIIPDIGAVERFRREARLAAGLSHPHIIPIFAVGDAPTLAYFVMKHVDGRALDSVLHNEGPQSATFVQAVLLQIGSALDYAHRKGIAHRDIKPANIMLDDGGWILLADFGIAKASDSLGLTSQGMIVGTPAYMAPETFSGDESGAAADQYALGCVAYELLTGERPFARRTVAEMVKAHLLEDPPNLAELSSAPRRLTDSIHRMLAKHPADRYPSLADLQQALGVVDAEAQQIVTTQIIKLAQSGSDLRPRISQPISPTPLNLKGRRETDPASELATSDGAYVDRIRRVAQVGRTPVAAVAILLMSIAIWRPQDRYWPAPVTMPLQAPGETTGLAQSTSGTSAPGSAPAQVLQQPDAPIAALTPPPSAASRTPTPPNSKPVPRTASQSPLASPNNVREPVSSKVSGESASAVVPAEADKNDTQPTRATPAMAKLVIGSRVTDAYLYVNGKNAAYLYKKPLQVIELTPGTYRLMITATDCSAPWQSVLTLVAGDSVRLGYINPSC